MKLNRFKSCIVTVLTAAASLSVRAQQTNKVSARDFSTFKDIVDWNIFDPHRHGPAPAFTPRPPMVDRFWLSGTMSYAKGVYAVFDGTQAEFQKVAQAGAKVANYTVTSIGDDSVKLTIGTQRDGIEDGHGNASQRRRQMDGGGKLGRPGICRRLWRAGLRLRSKFRPRRWPASSRRSLRRQRRRLDG